ncbi:MAG: protein kinase/transcriptional regulator, LuxR family protein, partial [Myxococcaceae bacterium]|nr:protein kinase/transcriptional regulator, LuxR family protein [Myxococcaceae bacterium]
MTAATDQQTAKKLGRYKLLARVGRGGMADVFLAYADGPRGFNKLVVVKALRLPEGDEPDEWMKMFFGEAKLAARLSHTNIVQTFEVGEQSGIPFMAMEYLEGKPLSALVRAIAAPFPPSIAARFVADLLAGLQYAHELKDYDGSWLNIVHRDVSPNNLMITYDGELKILDFGIAKSAASDVHTRTGVLKGKLSYMAPEQAGLKPVDQRADVFCAGIVLWELLAGRRLNRGDSPETRLYQLVFEPKPALQDVVPGIDPALDRIAARALQTAPADRYASAREMKDDLEAYLRASGSRDAQAEIVAMMGRLFSSDRERVNEQIRSLLESASLEHDHGVAVIAIEEESGPRTPERDDAQGEISARTASSRVPAKSNHLPAPLSELVGRTTELSAATHVMEQTRLLTLTGPGGSGKTSLAIGVGHRIASRFPGGCYYVALAAVSDPALVPAGIAEGLGIRDLGGQDMLDTIGAAIGEKSVLLVIDNFEQLVDGAPALSTLLEKCPELRILVTSRMVLHIQGERELQVPPLATPDLRRLPALAALAEVPSVRLFCQRARQVHPFELTTENASSVATICAQLDGLPLAIELAAARTRVLPPAQLAARLTNRLKLLTGGARNVPARQRTLRDTIAWSYDLLSPEEQSMFCRLGVFAGGCSLEAAEAICGDGVDVLEGLGSLVDKSLLRRTDGPDGVPRFVMLETLREFALERLVAEGAHDDVQRRHAEYFRLLAGSLRDDIASTYSARSLWLRRLAADQDNLRAAIRWSCVSGDAEIAMHIVGDLWLWYWLFCFAEGRRIVDEVLRVSPAPSVARSKALYTLSLIAWGQADFAAMRQAGEENLALCDALQDEVQGAWARLAIGMGLVDDFDRGMRVLGEAKATFGRLGNRWAFALSHGLTGVLTLMAQRPDLSHEQFTQGRILFSELGDEWMLAIQRFWLGMIDIQRGQLPSA